MKNIQKSFSKSSKSYNKNSFIQQEIAKILVDKIDKKYLKIVDIGCGDGAIINNISWEFDKFLAVDFSNEMLKLHKKDFNIETFKADFDDNYLFKKIADENYQLLISSSALQWSQDIKQLFDNIANLKIDRYLAIFTNKTFTELHKYFKINSPIISKNDILNSCRNYKYEILNKEIQFENSLEILKYIKRSGVSGGDNFVSNTKIREFISSNQINSLTLEIILLWQT